MSVNKYRYEKINNNLSEYELPEIITHVPAPLVDDYKRGFIKRYFIQKANDSTGYIYEIDSLSFLNFKISPFFNVVIIRWRISGSVDEIKESNFNSIKIGMKTISSLHLYLPNYLQFSKQ
jgi:hypothetical protein